MNAAIILNRHEMWISLLECLFLHTPKNYCFDVQPFKYQISISFCKSSLWHLQHIPRNWFSILDHVHDYSQAGVGSTSRCSACSWLQVGTESFIDCSVFFQNRESGFYFTRILAAYQKCTYGAPDELGIFQRITKWARTTNHPGCSHVLRFHDGFQLKCVSTDGHRIDFAHQV